MSEQEGADGSVANARPDPLKTFGDRSRLEFEAMLQFVANRESIRPPVLIDVWGVHALCGPNLLRSVDIDLVLRSRDRDSLIHWVVGALAHLRDQVGI